MFKAPKLNFETQFYWVLKEPYYFRLNHSPRLTPLAKDLDLDLDSVAYQVLNNRFLSPKRYKIPNFFTIFGRNPPKKID